VRKVINKNFYSSVSYPLLYSAASSHSSIDPSIDSGSDTVSNSSASRRRLTPTLRRNRGCRAGAGGQLLTPLDSACLGDLLGDSIPFCK